MAQRLRWAWGLVACFVLAALPAHPQQQGAQSQQPGQRAQQQDEQRYPQRIEIFGGSSQPGPSAPTKPVADCGVGLVDQAMDASGISDSISLAGSRAGNAARRIASGSGTSSKEREEQAFLGPFTDAAVYRAFVKQSLLDDCDPGMLEAVINEYRTPLGQKMRRLEALSIGPQAAPELRRYAAALRQHPPRPARAELVERLIDDMHDVDFWVQARLEIWKVAIRVLAGRELTAEQQARLEQAEETMRPILRRAALTQRLFTYRQATDHELEQYIALQETQPSQRFFLLARQGFVAALRNQAEQGTAAAQRARGARPPHDH